MKKFQSKTVNGGETIILDSLQVAIEKGQPSANKRGNGEDFKAAVAEIFGSDEKLNAKINDMVAEIVELVDDICPSLSVSASSVETSTEGYAVSPERLAAGEERAMFNRARDARAIKEGAADGAYRVIINTDVSWWGDPQDNSALMGALIVCLARFRPVEIMIQQGWMGYSEGDGVTLFKLDYSGGFNPSQMHFWLGSKYKDGTFSYYVNKGLGRRSCGTSCHAEAECDLFLRGDWMVGFNIGEATPLTERVVHKRLGDESIKNLDLGPESVIKTTWSTMLFTEKKEVIAEWIKATACKIVFGAEDSEGFAS